MAVTISYWSFVGYITSLAMYAEIVGGFRRWTRSKSKFVDNLLACAFCTALYTNVVGALAAERFGAWGWTDQTPTVWAYLGCPFVVGLVLSFAEHIANASRAVVGWLIGDDLDGEA